MPKVCIDPGHGGGDSGAAYGTLLEKDITLGLGLALRDKLVLRGVDVIMTRESDRRLGKTKTADLKARAKISAESNSDFFVSLHVDSATGNSLVRGVHGFYYNEKCPNGKKLATAIAKRVSDACGFPYSYGSPSSPHWYRLGVFRYYQNWFKVTCALVEHGFITNEKDRAIMTGTGYIDKCASAICSGIVSQFTAPAPPMPVSTPMPDSNIREFLVVDAESGNVLWPDGKTAVVVPNGNHIGDAGFEKDKVYVKTI